MAATAPCCASFARLRRPDRAARLFAWLASALCAGAAAPAAAFESGRADFAVEIGESLVVPYRVFAVHVLPDERVSLAIADDAAGAYTAEADKGSVEAAGPRAWYWHAPPVPGVVRLVVRGPADEIRLNVVVVHPATRVSNGRLNGYRIGAYPPPLRGDPAYRAPEGFIELTPELLDLELSPHFRLRQFPSKQAGDQPKYLVLREQLLLKLELLLERLNERGIAADSLTVMSGYRTPFYNRAIDNVASSRHVYGGAADIYVDVAPRDGRMDDLNGDGRSDHRDAQWLYRLADELFAEEPHRALHGGLGVYRSTSAHGPFLHVDARGRRARWGLLP